MSHGRAAILLLATAVAGAGCGDPFSVGTAGPDGGPTDAASDAADGDASSPDGEPQPDLLTGLVAYWKLDGSTEDSSPSGADLTAYPGTAPAVPYGPGKVGQGLHPGLGATVLCENCVTLQSQPNPALEFGDGDFTIAVWAARTPSPGVDGIWWSYGLLDNGQLALSASSSGPHPTPAYPTLRLINAAIQLAIVQDSRFDFRAAPNADVWAHIIAFRRGSTIGLRVNGGPETTASVQGQVGVAGTFYLAMIQEGYPWQGAVDEVGMWKRALSPDEMEALYNDGQGWRP